MIGLGGSGSVIIEGRRGGRDKLVVPLLTDGCRRYLQVPPVRWGKVVSVRLARLPFPQTVAFRVCQDFSHRMNRAQIE